MAGLLEEAGMAVMWLLFGVAAWLAAVAGGIGLCRAAAEGDRLLAQLPVDELERLYAEPDRYCPTCGGWLAGDDLFDSAECQGAWLA
jgi:hypothetical protein